MYRGVMRPNPHPRSTETTRVLLRIEDDWPGVIMLRRLKSFYVGYDKRDIERDMGVLFIFLCTTKKKL